MTVRVHDLMKTEVRTVTPELPVPDLERRFLEDEVGAFPVVEAGKLVGVVSRSDVVRQLVTEIQFGDYVSEFYVDVSGFGPEKVREDLAEVARRAGARVEELSVGDLMSRAVLSVDADDSIAEAARFMAEGHLHRLPVTRGGKLVGILSSLDLVRLVADGRLKPAGSPRELAG